MNIKLIKLLAIASFVLLIIVLLEWVYFHYTYEQLLDEIANVKNQDYQADQLPTLALEKKQESEFKAIIERPLFIEGRRELQNVEEETAQTVETSLKDWQLTGIYSVKQGLTALFVSNKKNAGKKTKKLKQGEELAGRKLLEIKMDRIILEQNGRKKVLLLRDPKSKKKRAVPVTKRKTMAPTRKKDLKKAVTH